MEGLVGVKYHVAVKACENFMDEKERREKVLKAAKEKFTETHPTIKRVLLRDLSPQDQLDRYLNEKAQWWRMFPKSKSVADLFYEMGFLNDSDRDKIKNNDCGWWQWYYRYEEVKKLTSLEKSHTKGYLYVTSDLGEWISKWVDYEG